MCMPCLLLVPDMLQFWHTLDSIPRGSLVVLVLGEIDCREGLPVAMDKGKVGKGQHIVGS
jgi:hypothetical protein